MRHASTYFAFVFGILPSLSCSEFGINPDDERINIQEVVIRFQMVHSGPGSPTMYFLAFSDYDSSSSRLHFKDPDDAFMSRFAFTTLPVKRRSHSRTEPGGGIYDLQTGVRGVLLWVAGVRHISETEAEVVGGYYAGGLNAETDLFHLRKTGGRWWVYRYTLISVS